VVELIWAAVAFRRYRETPARERDATVTSGA
jgi:hypothetical protein